MHNNTRVYFVINLTITFLNTSDENIITALDEKCFLNFALFKITAAN